MNLPGVKPASDWLEQLKWNNNCASSYMIIEAIQAQAFAAGVQQGMTEAAQIVDCTPIRPHAVTDKIRQAIRAARDAKIKSQ